MACKQTRREIIEWPFETVRPDGTVPPPTKTERINTYLEDQLIQDDRTRKLSYGIGNDPSFLRQGNTTKPHKRGIVTINTTVRPQDLKKDEKKIKEFIQRNDKTKEENKSYKTSLPLISSRLARKPILMTNHRGRVFSKQQASVSVDVYHCCLHCVHPTLTGERKPAKKKKLYTGVSSKHNIKGVDNEEERVYQLDGSSSGPKPTPQDCLRSFRQVRDGRKRYDVFWTPATSQQVKGQLLLNGQESVDSELYRGSDNNKVHMINGEISEQSSNMSNRNSPDQRKSVSFGVEKPPEKLLSDEESDYNDRYIGNVDLSSGSDTGSTCGDPSLRVTGPELRSSIREVVNLNGEDFNEDFKHAIEEYVAQIINQAHGMYQNSVKNNGTAL